MTPRELKDAIVSGLELLCYEVVEQEQDENTSYISVDGKDFIIQIVEMPNE